MAYAMGLLLCVAMQDNLLLALLKYELVIAVKADVFHLVLSYLRCRAQITCRARPYIIPRTVSHEQKAPVAPSS